MANIKFIFEIHKHISKFIKTIVSETTYSNGSRIYSFQASP